MPSNAGFTRLSNLPGQRPVQRATESVGQFKNQVIPGLSSGTSAPAQQQGSPTEQLLSMRRPQTNVQMSARRVTDAVKTTNQKLMASAQARGQQRRQAMTQRQAPASSQGQYKGAQTQKRGSAPAPAQPRATGGPAVGRLQGILKGFPGLRITEIGGDRSYDVAHGVARVPTSYHYDRANPAVDIAGSTGDLNRLYKTLVAQGGWRQILWQVPGHYDHIHVAEHGGVIGAPGPMGTDTVAVEDAPTHDFGDDTVPAMLKPGEVVVTKEAADAIGPENLVAANEEVAEDEGEGPPPPEDPMGSLGQPAEQRYGGIDVSGLAMMAYSKLPPEFSSAITPGTKVSGVRTALRNLRPGDIVAWKDGSHLAIYAGNGEIMESNGAGKRKLWAPESEVQGIALRLPGE